jgi:hypothetical protein
VSTTSPAPADARRGLPRPHRTSRRRDTQMTTRARAVAA